VPVMLSNFSGAMPGAAMMTAKELAAEPLAIETEILLPKEPVYLEVKVIAFVADACMVLGHKG
jgi:hypothetical protein